MFFFLHYAREAGERGEGGGSKRSVWRWGDSTGSWVMGGGGLSCKYCTESQERYVEAWEVWKRKREVMYR